MEILQLRYFMAVMEYGNFTKAARATYTSQSNISKQMAQLEEELESSLFFRTNTGVEATRAGKYLYQGLKKLLPEFDSLLDQTKECSKNVSQAVLRLGLCESMDLERIIPDFARFFHQENPGTELFIEAYPFTELLKKLAVRELDCVFYFSILEAEIPGLKRLPVSRDFPKLYYSTKHPLNGKGDLCVEDFKEETFVRSSKKREIMDQYDALPFYPKRVIETNSLNAAFLYIETGQAAGVFGPSQNRLGKENIKTLELSGSALVGTDALWISGNNNPVLGQFLHFLRAHAGKGCHN